MRNAVLIMGQAGWHLSKTGSLSRTKSVRLWAGEIGLTFANDIRGRSFGVSRLGTSGIWMKPLFQLPWREALAVARSRSGMVSSWRFSFKKLPKYQRLPSA